MDDNNIKETGETIDNSEAINKDLGNLYDNELIDPTQGTITNEKLSNFKRNCYFLFCLALIAFITTSYVLMVKQKNEAEVAAQKLANLKAEDTIPPGHYRLATGELAPIPYQICGPQQCWFADAYKEIEKDGENCIDVGNGRLLLCGTYSIQNLID